MLVTEGESSVRVSANVVSEGVLGDSWSGVSVGACLRLRDLSWARRDLRSCAAAERASWEDMVRMASVMGVVVEVLRQEMYVCARSYALDCVR